MNRVLLCSPETYLEVLDPDTLNAVGKIATRNDQYIYDFVLDDTRGRVFVLSMRGDNAPRLTSYSLLNGSQQQEAMLPPTNEGRMMLALVEKTGQVAVAVDHYHHGGDKSDVYLCGSEATLACINFALIDRASQISSLGEELLVATSTFADRKKECLLSVDLATHLVSRKYCSPATGVHYAVGVTDNKYVIGFTGIAKRLVWKEKNAVVENSFSVWRAGNSQIAAIAKEPTNYGGLQSIVKIFANRTEPLFIAYIGESNVLYLYSIVDLK